MPKKNGKDNTKQAICSKKQSSSDSSSSSDSESEPSRKTRERKRIKNGSDSGSEESSEHVKVRPRKMNERRDWRRSSGESHRRTRRSRSRSVERRQRRRSRERSRSSDRRTDKRRKSRSKSPDYRRRRHRSPEYRGIISRAKEKPKFRKHSPVPLHMNMKVIKHAEEIKKRKLLFQKKPDEEKKASAPWGTLVNATCSDDKSAEKFKKLMGIKADEEGTTEDCDEAGMQVLKQAELFHNLGMQYDTARMSTHTHRGVGFGFSSHYMELAAQARAAREGQSSSS